MQGNVSTGTTDNGNPVKVGGVVRTALPNPGTQGQRYEFLVDKFGRLVTLAESDRALVATSTVTVSTTTETTLLTAATSTVFHDLTHLSCTNTSATIVRVDVRDATAGTVRQSWSLAASGGGFTTPFRPPWPQTTAANNWTITLSGAVTDVRCQVQAVKNK